MNQIPTEDKFNIVGVVVNTRPDVQTAVKSMLNSVAGIEIHAAENGRLAITIDDSECDTPLVDTITQINSLSGVLSTSIAYHHFEGGIANQETQL